jgi:hypothetical protein
MPKIPRLSGQKTNKLEHVTRTVTDWLGNWRQHITLTLEEYGITLPPNPHCLTLYIDIKNIHILCRVNAETT